LKRVASAQPEACSQLHTIRQATGTGSELLKSTAGQFVSYNQFQARSDFWETLNKIFPFVRFSAHKTTQKPLTKTLIKFNIGECTEMIPQIRMFL
jgi:hypothetical protein